MKRPVSLFASLVLVASVGAACSAVEAGKAEFADVCMKRYGNSQAKCDCFVGALETNLSPELFSTLAEGAYTHREFAAKDWLPNTVRDDPRIASELRDATAACLS